MQQRSEVGVAVDGCEIALHVGGQDVLVSWHPPPSPPTGTRHGAEGICTTRAGDVVLISRDGRQWECPAGRPEGDESWEETLRREVREEGCARVLRAKLLGFSRGECIAGPEKGLVLVRSIWRADVDVEPWNPQFEITYRKIVAPTYLVRLLSLGDHPFTPIIRRALREADIDGGSS